MSRNQRLKFCEPIRLNESYSFLVDTSDRDYSIGWAVTFTGKDCITATDSIFEYDLSGEFIEARPIDGSQDDQFTVETSSGEIVIAALRVSISDEDIRRIISDLSIDRFYVGLHVAQLVDGGIQEHLITSAQIKTERVINER